MLKNMIDLQNCASDIKIYTTEESRLLNTNFDNLPFGSVFSDHQFVADYRDGQWQDLRIEPYQNLVMSPANVCLHYGQSVFEGMKAFRNADDDVFLFRPDENAKRLNLSARRMCIPEIPEQIFHEGMCLLLELDKNWIPSASGASLYIRPFIYSTDDCLGVRPSTTYRFIIFSCPVAKYYSEPVKVKVETQFSRACEGGIGAAKTAGNYAASLYPAKLAQEKGYHQLIWTDSKTHQYIEEAGTMNVMFVIGDKLITAKTSDTILDGITRKSVLQIAKEWGVTVEERKLSVSELVKAIENGSLVEAFGTGTAATIAPICLISFDGTDYELPAVPENALSKRLLHELDQVRRGLKVDTRNWIWKI